MKIENARKAIDGEGCEGCEHWKEDKHGFECMTKDEFKCEEHKILAARTVIAALEAELAEAKTAQQRLHKMLDEKMQKMRECYQQRDSYRKRSSDRLDVVNKQAVTILSMRNCENCENGAFGYECSDSNCSGVSTYEEIFLAKWRPGKQVVK